MQQQLLPAIWSASASTLSFTNKAVSFQKSKRFELNSIYHKDDPFKTKKQLSPFCRPEMILQEFRKKIKEATKSYHVSGLIKKKKTDQQDDKKYQTINLKAIQVTGRLYESSPSLLQLRYDLNGNRSFFYQSQNNNQKINELNQRSLSPKDLKTSKMQHKDSDNIYITSTPRTDFSRPLNFNPGPGSYTLPHYNKQKQEKTRISKISGQSLENSFDGKSSTLSQTILDGSSVLIGKKSSVMNKFSSVDTNQLFKERRENMFEKRNEKQKNKKRYS